MKTLIVGNLTIDHIDGSLRIGGPGYYGGLALGKYLGCDTYLYTSMNPYYRVLFKPLYEYVKVYEHRCVDLPEFVIKGGRAVRIENKGCILSCEELDNLLDEVKPEIIIFAPVLNEINECMVRLVKDKEYVKVKTLDLQGFTRKVSDNGEISYRWSNEYNRIFNYVDLIHGNYYEYKSISSTYGLGSTLYSIKSLSERVSAGLALSIGGLGLYLLYRGEAYYVPALKVDVADEVGAGDVFLSISSYYMVSNNLLDSVVYGVIAGSLKVTNAYKSWFSREDLDRIHSVHRRKVVKISV